MMSKYSYIIMIIKKGRGFGGKSGNTIDTKIPKDLISLVLSLFLLVRGWGLGTGDETRISYQYSALSPFLPRVEEEMILGTRLHVHGLRLSK